jgi:hypothetical protein
MLRIRGSAQVQLLIFLKFFQLRIRDWRLPRIDQFHSSRIYIRGYYCIILSQQNRVGQSNIAQPSNDNSQSKVLGPRAELGVTDNMICTNNGACL